MSAARQWHLLDALSTLVEADVEAELDAQIAAFRDAFDQRLPAHIDGHNHCHVLSDVVARAVASRMLFHGIRRIRLPRELPSPAVALWLADYRRRRSDDADEATRDALTRTLRFNELVAQRSATVEPVSEPHRIALRIEFDARRRGRRAQLFDAAQLTHARYFLGLYLLLACDDAQSDAVGAHSGELKERKTISLAFVILLLFYSRQTCCAHN